MQQEVFFSFNDIAPETYSIVLARLTNLSTNFSECDVKINKSAVKASPACFISLEEFLVMISN